MNRLIILLLMIGCLCNPAIIYAEVGGGGSSRNPFIPQLPKKVVRPPIDISVQPPQPDITIDKPPVDTGEPVVTIDD